MSVFWKFARGRGSSSSPGNVNGVSIKPYVIATGALLADTAYMGGFGGGVTLHASVKNVSLDPYAEFIQQSFRNSTFYPLASGMTGPLSTYGILASGPVGSGLSWQSRVAYAHANDQVAFDSYDSFLADVWLPWNFTVGSGRPWTLIPTAGVTTWNYKAPDPIDRSAEYRACHGVARRSRARNSDLAEIRSRLFGAISFRPVERRSVRDA